jgi:hypothetical protein
MAKAFCATRDGAADPPQPEHAEGLATRAPAERQWSFHPGARANVRVAIEDFAQMDENQRECEIGHILGQDVRSVGDADAT